jgi:hypothetical protein
MQVRQGRNFFSLAFLLTLLLLTTGTLAAQDVKYNFMPGTDFSKYQTYKWVGIEGVPTPTKLWTHKSSSLLTRN